MHSRLRPLLQYYSKSHMDGLRPAISGLGLHMDSLIMVLSIKESMVCTTVSDLQVRVEAHTQSEREKERQTDRQTGNEHWLRVFAPTLICNGVITQPLPASHYHQSHTVAVA